MPSLCKEWIENIEGTAVGFSDHEWVEIENNSRIQVLRCEKCKKISTAKHLKEEDLIM